MTTTTANGPGEPTAPAPQSGAASAMQEQIALARLRIERDVKLRAEEIEAAQQLAALREPARISWWLPAGMGGFGLMLGGICGLSNVQGISQALLTLVPTFVGGVLLTYAGFKRVSSTRGDAGIDAGKVGAALLFFSVAVLAAAVGSAAVRFRVNTGVNARAADVARVAARDDADRARRQAREDAELQRAWASEDAKAALELAIAYKKQGLAPPAATPAPTLPPAPAQATTPPAPTAPVAYLGLQNKEAQAKCKAVAERILSGTEWQPDFAAPDIGQLYALVCTADKPRTRTCDELEAQVDAENKVYTGQDPRTAIVKLYVEACGR